MRKVLRLCLVVNVLETVRKLSVYDSPSPSDVLIVGMSVVVNSDDSLTTDTSSTSSSSSDSAHAAVFGVSTSTTSRNETGEN